MIALVVFHNRDSSHFFNWTLAKNFRHVFVCLKTEDGWIEIDYLGGKTGCRVMAPCTYDMKKHYEDQDCIVVPTVQRRLDTPIRSLFRFPYLVNNCTGLAQSLLGITGLIVTPYSLFRRIQKDK